MSKFDATYGLPALIFFATLCAAPPAPAATQQNPATPQANQTSSPVPEAPQTAPATPSNQPETPSSPSLKSDASGNPPLQHVITSPPPTPERPKRFNVGPAALSGSHRRLLQSDSDDRRNLEQNGHCVPNDVRGQGRRSLL